MPPGSKPIQGCWRLFLKQSAELQLNLSHCRGQCCDNGANTKGKEVGVQARILRINLKALFVPSANQYNNFVQKE